MKKILVILVAVIGFSLSADANPVIYTMGKYCNEDGVQLSLHKTSDAWSWKGNFQMYIPGEGSYNGTFEISNGNITLKCDNVVKTWYGSIHAESNSRYRNAAVKISGFKDIKPYDCR